MRPEFGEAERLGQLDDLVVALDVLRIDEIGVGVQADQVHVLVAGVVRGRLRAVVGPVDPEQIVQALGLREVVEHVPPDADEHGRVLATPPEPAAVHLVKRPPQDDDIGVLQFLESVGEDVEFLHPPRVGLAARRDDRLQIDALVAESAALWIGRVVKVRTDRHQPALAAVVDGQAVHRLGLDAALAEIGVVQADHGRPVSGLVERILAVGQLGTGTELVNWPETSRFSVCCGSFSR